MPIIISDHYFVASYELKTLAMLTGNYSL